jgi:hypothetical protein
MRNFTEELGITGYLTIIKRFQDGTEETIFDDHNIIVSGMGVGLSYMFNGSGSNTVLDYQIERFQLGTSGKDGITVDRVLETSATFSLSGALSSIAQYGTGSNMYIEDATQIKNSVDFRNQFFPLIPAIKITRVEDSSVRYTLVVDEEACNNLTDELGNTVNLNEIGLFMKNPRGDSDPNASILAAYRVFNNVYKTSDFSLIFRWTLNF